ncbi:MAG: UMP kinase [Chlamydiales bacterium 38-26]|nr:UMP kinase [Chlamydiales bacterium]OJV11181.1 MAG: UMP kinase [Chlamydiales bacterium 38-26]
MIQIIPPKRVLLKLSGEILKGDLPFGIHTQAVQKLASDLKNLQNEGIELGIVIGGGNIFRGLELKTLSLPRTPADQIGMLATIMNGIAIQQALQFLGCPVKLMTALECPDVAESYNWQLANEYLSKGFIVIFVGGTGNPYFTTDSAAALRACEIHADLFLKATKVDGVYNQDPLKFPNAEKYPLISYSQFLNEKLEVLDATAITLCMKNRLPIFVFNMGIIGKQSLKDLLSNTENGTLIS